ncbi:MAG: AEC family transporter [Roseburia hominis]|nr:AEC family transporter [Roseburia hominis]
MSLVFGLTVKILILMAVGFAGKKCGLIDEVCKEKLSGLLVNLLMPVCMLVSSQQTFRMERLRGAAVVALIAAVYYGVAFAVGMCAGKAAGFERKKRVIFTLLIAFANTGFVGLPVLTQLIGESGMLYGAIYNCVFDILYFSYGLYLLVGREGCGVRGLFSNVMIWVAVATVVIYMMPWRFPAVVTEALGMLGDTMMPVSMLIIGAEIAEMDLRTILTDRSAYGVSLLRMVVFPAATLLTMRVLGVDYEVAATAVVLGAMPSGSLNVIMAQKYHTHPAFAATAVMQNTILMIVTLPFFLYLCERFCGG